MAIIGNNADSFLHALSDFWTRFFADMGDLRATYEGTSIVLGQAYLDLLGTVLNTSVTDAPLFRKEYYRLLALREDQLRWVQDFDDPTNSRWAFDPGISLLDLGTIQNKVYRPDAILVLGDDVDVVEGELRFVVDPSADASLLTAPYKDMTNRAVEVAVGGTFSNGTLDWVAAGVKKGDVLRTHPYAALVRGDRALPDSQAYRIVHVTTDELRFSVDTPAPDFPPDFTQAPVAWWIDREGPSGQCDLTLPYVYLTPAAAVNDKGTFGPSKNVTLNEVSVWALDAKVDDFALYENFGHMVTSKEASTEAYRALVKGLMQLYVFGPVIDRIESAMNVIASLPVVRSDGEVLSAYDSGVGATWNGVSGTFSGGLLDVGVNIFSGNDVGGFLEVTRADDTRNVGVWRVTEIVSGSIIRLSSPAGTWAQAGGVHWEYSRTDQQTVTTTANTYQFDRRIPIRTDVMDPLNVGVLTLKTFEALTTAVRVVDYIKDPTWWHNLPVPEFLLPSWSTSRRLASTQLLENKVGDVYQGCVGDPGFYVGADENGTPGGVYRHYPAFILMDRFLQAHIFQVKINRNVKMSPAFIAQLSDVIRQSKPAYTFAYLQPGTEFSEEINVIDALERLAARLQSESLAQQAHPLTVGSSPSWNVGDEWYFSATQGYAVTVVAAGSGYTPFTVGGLDPQTVPAAGICESALYVKAV